MKKRNMLRFPLFVDLTGRLAVVAGGGKVALRRAEVLASFGARVRLVAPDAEAPCEHVEVCRRRFEPEDLQGAFLAVAATDDRAVNRAIGEAARTRNLPVSVADAPEECTFFFPAVCLGGGLVAGVVSDGTEHNRTAAAARAIRSTLRELE